MDTKLENTECTINRYNSAMIDYNKRKKKYLLDSNSYVKQKSYSLNKIGKKNNLIGEIKPFAEKKILKAKINCRKSIIPLTYLIINWKIGIFSIILIAINLNLIII